MSTSFIPREGRYVYLLPREMWYDQSTEGPEINAVHMKEDDSLGWSFTVRQLPVDGLQVEVKEEGWAALTGAHEIFAALTALADTHHGSLDGISISDVQDLLDRFGFEDITERTDNGGPVPMAWQPTDLQHITDHLGHELREPDA